MELYQIRHFAAVAETGGFTKAAIRAAVSGQYLRMVRARRGGGRMQIAAWLKS
jgi:DNA-binding transcriptional LysR family regulator